MSQEPGSYSTEACERCGGPLRYAPEIGYFCVGEICFRQDRDRFRARAEARHDTWNREQTLEWALRQILQSLPVKRDWLDPDVEKVARDLVVSRAE